MAPSITILEKQQRAEADQLDVSFDQVRGEDEHESKA